MRYALPLLLSSLFRFLHLVVVVVDCLRNTKGWISNVYSANYILFVFRICPLYLRNPREFCFFFPRLFRFAFFFIDGANSQMEWDKEKMKDYSPWNSNINNNEQSRVHGLVCRSDTLEFHTLFFWKKNDDGICGALQQFFSVFVESIKRVDTIYWT
jgi:hypothetical protein